MEPVAELFVSRSRVSVFVCVLVALTVLVPPNGVLTHNEEYYLQSADLYFDGAPIESTSALLSHMPHTFVFSNIAGFFVNTIGYEYTQIVGRVATSLLMAASLTVFFGLLSMTVAEAVTALLVFYFIGQDILGGEWLFLGFEAKVLAYPFAIVGLVLALNRKSASTLFFVAATYAHFLVGGFWFVIGAVVSIWNGLPFRRIYRDTLLYVALCAPLIVLIAVAGFDFVTPSDDFERSQARHLYKYIAYPHHTAPFSSFKQTLLWAPGVSLLCGMFIANFMLMRRCKGIEQQLARVNFLVLGWLLLAIPISLIDLPGYIAPFYLFRPSSLALLIFVCQVLLQLRLPSKQLRSFAGPLLVVSLFWLAPLLALNGARDVYGYVADSDSRRSLIRFVRDNSERNDVFLIEPKVSLDLLWFERETGRFAYVIDKFKPSTSATMVEWSNRKQARNRIFRGDCRPIEGVNVRYLITAAKSRVSCGERLLSTRSFDVHKAVLEPDRSLEPSQ